MPTIAQLAIQVITGINISATILAPQVAIYNPTSLTVPHAIFTVKHV